MTNMENSEQLTKAQIFYRKNRTAILAAQKRYYQKNKAAKQAYQREFNRWKKDQAKESSE